MALAAKAFSDLITFTRASTAGYYGSDGLYKTAASGVARTGTYADYKPADITQQNILTYSSGFDNAAWTKSNGFVQTNLLLQSNDFQTSWTPTNITRTLNSILSPSGNVDGVKIAATAAVTTELYQDVIVSATSATASIYVKQGTGATAANAFGIRNVTTATNLIIGTFNYGTGVFTYTVGSTGVTVTDAGNGWWRIQFSSASGITSGNTVRLYVGFLGATPIAGDFLYAYGAQLVQGSVAGDYRATTSAALPVLYADPLGTTLAQKFCENNAASVQHMPQQTVTLPSSSAVTVSVYLKAGERTQARVLNYDAGTNYYGVIVNLLDGSLVTTVSGGTVTNTGYTITAVGSGWYRVTVTATIATGARQFYVNPAQVGGGVLYTGDGSSGVYMFGAQINEGATALPYLATTATGGHATTTGAKRGFLVEPQRTNLLLRSNDWSASWGLVNVTQTPAQATGPDGTVSMTKLAATTTAATLSNQAFAATSTAMVYSIYVKQGSGATEANEFAWYNNTTATTLAMLSINYATGVITQTTGTGATVEPIGNGIWRLSVPVSSGITVGNSVQVYPCFVGGVKTAGIFAYVYGAQVEAGSEASSYIPTTTAQVTRADDIQNVNVVTPWHSATEGTYLIEFQTGYTGACSRSHILLAHDASATKRLVYISNGSEYASSYDGATGTASSTDATGMVAKVALAYDASGRYMSVRGSAVTSTTNVAGFTSATSLSFGGYANWNLPAWIRLVKFYPRRFSNTDLPILSA